MILKTSGGIGSLMVAPRLFDHRVLRIGTIENSSENALILLRMPRLNGWRESSKSEEIFCSQIDPAQAVKVTGFNHGGHRVFKPILRASPCPLWLYPLLMPFVPIAVLCIQMTIAKSTEITGFLASVVRIIKTAGVKP